MTTAILGLSGREEYLALAQLERDEEEREMEKAFKELEFEEETTESMMDDDSDEVEEPYEQYDDNGGYN